MTDVRTRVDDVLRTVHVDAPDPRVAWSRGRRRRMFRTTAVAAAVLAVVGVGASLVTGRGVPDALPPAGSSDSVDQYPQRIDDPWLTRDIEDAPPVLAGTLMAGRTLYGVAEDGALYEIPQGDNTGDFRGFVSNDGSKVAYLQDKDSFVVRHLGTGEVVEYDGLGDNRGGTTEPYMTQGQTPGFWSPDDRHLIIWGWETESNGPVMTLVLDDEGGLRLIPQPGPPVGWADVGHPAFLAKVRGGVELVTTDLSGEVTQRVELEVPERIGRWLNQWTGSLSSDGSRVLVADDEGENRYLLDADTGRRIRAANFTTGDASCPASWRGDRPLVHASAPDIGSSLVDGMGSDPVVVVEPSLDDGCLTLVPMALAGDPAFAPLGTSSVWPTWHVGEIALTVLGLLAAARWWRRWRRRPTVRE